MHEDCPLHLWLTGQWQHRKLIGVNHVILLRLYLKQLMALWNVDRLGIATNKKYLVSAKSNKVTGYYQIYRNFFTYLCIIIVRRENCFMSYTFL
jgi:hypothetical protein